MMSTTTPLDDRDTGLAGPLRIAVILGSAGEGRAGEPINRWLVDQIAAREDIEVDLVDLAEDDLPTVLPGGDDATRRSSVEGLGARLDSADGFVVVTTEYDHGLPASLKNAVDSFSEEWNAKPVSFVSYAGMGRAVRTVQRLRQVFIELHAVPTRDGVSIDLDEVDHAGHPTSDGIEAAVAVMVDQLEWWATALREARRRQPYG